VTAAETAMVAELTDLAVLQQEEMIATTIAMMKADHQLSREYAHPDCDVCRVKLKMADQAIEAMRRIFD
jgi:surfactin synthase thioesterase subunit